MINAVYAHIPFCASKCGYCSFNSYSGMEEHFDAYASALRADIEMSAATVAADKITSIYFGGGTPYYWGVERLTEMLELLQRSWAVDTAAEISLEANPGDLSVDGLAMLRQAGFNRISIGAQSFSDRCLRMAGRRHRSADIEHGVKAARRAGFRNISLDLIYGLPGQSLDRWRKDLQKAVDLEPKHISIYGLTLESPTSLWRSVQEGRVSVAGDDLQAEMYESGSELLEGKGYPFYELSSFAPSGRECAHNINYWRMGSYLGVGAGAHSYTDSRRYWKEARPELYIKSLAEGGSGIEGGEDLSPEQLAGDEAILALRMREGLDVDRFASRYGPGFLEDKSGSIAELIGLDLVAPGRRLVLTQKGRLLANEVMQAFV